jgi:hypothetical protein
MDGRHVFRIWIIANAPGEDWNNPKVPSELIQKSLRPVTDKHCARFKSGLVSIVLKMIFDKYRDDLDHRFRNDYDLHKSDSILKLTLKELMRMVTRSKA